MRRPFPPVCRRRARVRIPETPGTEKHGGEGGIRTLGTVLPVQPLSRRLPSAGSATSPQDPGGGSRIRTCGASPPSGFQDRRLQPLGHPSRKHVFIPDPVAAREQKRGAGTAANADGMITGHGIQRSTGVVAGPGDELAGRRGDDDTRVGGRSRRLSGRPDRPARATSRGGAVPPSSGRGRGDGLRTARASRRGPRPAPAGRGSATPPVRRGLASAKRLRRGVDRLSRPDPGTGGVSHRWTADPPHRARSADPRDPRTPRGGILSVPARRAGDTSSRAGGVETRRDGGREGGDGDASRVPRHRAGRADRDDQSGRDVRFREAVVPGPVRRRRGGPFRRMERAGRRRGFDRGSPAGRRDRSRDAHPSWSTSPGRRRCGN